MTHSPSVADVADHPHRPPGVEPLLAKKSGFLRFACPRGVATLCPDCFRKEENQKQVHEYHQYLQEEVVFGNCASEGEDSWVTWKCEK